MKVELNRGVYAITDCENLYIDELLLKTERILDTGTRILQYRDKSKDIFKRYQRATLLQELCRRFNTTFIINDDIELTLAISADGVHIGKDDFGFAETRELLGDEAIIGVSCYDDFNYALTVQDMGADYITFGAFFPTTTKDNTTKANIDLLIRAKNEICIPIVVIGGITHENGGALVEAGADMLAVVSHLYLDEDQNHVITKLNQLFQ